MRYISSQALRTRFGEDADMTTTSETQRYASGRNCRVPALLMTAVLGLKGP
jgi:hypothetical protein